MFWDLTHYKLHRNNNCTRVNVVSTVQSEGQHLTSMDAGDKPCVTGRGQAEESRALEKKEDMQLQAGLHPHACQIPPHRFPGDTARVVCRARAFPDRSRHSRQYGGKIFRQCTEVGPQSVKHMALGLIRFMQ